MTVGQESLFPELEPASQEPVAEPDWDSIRDQTAAGGRESLAVRTIVPDAVSPTESFKNGLGGGPYPETGGSNPPSRHWRKDQRADSKRPGMDPEKARQEDHDAIIKQNPRMTPPATETEQAEADYSGEGVADARRVTAAIAVKSALGAANNDPAMSLALIEARGIAVPTHVDPGVETGDGLAQASEEAADYTELAKSVRDVGFGKRPYITKVSPDTNSEHLDIA